MSDEIQQKTSEEVQQEPVADVKPSEELSPEALSGVNGGASTTLFASVAKGTHINKAIITVAK